MIYINFWKKAWHIYIFVTLPLENKLSPLEIPQIWATPLGNSKTKNLGPMENPHDFFLITSIKSSSFLIDSGISACFFQYSFKFHLFNFIPSPLFLFFSGIGWQSKMCLGRMILKWIRSRWIRKYQVLFFTLRQLKTTDSLINSDEVA